MAEIARSTLHQALQDPVMASIGFLNDVMSQYPQALSFAPGAPHLSFTHDVDLAHYIETYVRHVAHTSGVHESRVRRVLYEYGPARGVINDLLAACLRRDCGIDARPDTIVVTVGAQEAMFLTLRTLFASPDQILAVANPCFVGAIGAARLLDIDMVAVGETEAGIDIEALARSCRAARRQGRRIRACYVAPDYANPGGSWMPQPARRRLLELAEREDLYLLEDNVYGFTAAAGSEVPTLKAIDPATRVIHIGTFAKICFPGARVGFVIADQTVDGGRVLADEIAAVKSMVTVNTSPIAQAVIAGMLLANGGSFSPLIQERSALYRRNLAALVTALDHHQSMIPPSVQWNRPQGGFFVRMTLPVPVTKTMLEVSASKYGVLWTPLAPFYLDGGGDNKLRLSASYLDPDEIELGVARLAEFLREEVP